MIFAFFSRNHFLAVDFIFQWIGDHFSVGGASSLGGVCFMEGASALIGEESQKSSWSEEGTYKLAETLLRKWFILKMYYLKHNLIIFLYQGKVMFCLMHFFIHEINPSASKVVKSWWVSAFTAEYILESIFES